MKLLDITIEAISNLNLSNVKIYETKSITPFFDYVIIATCSSVRQMDAVISHIEDEVTKKGFMIRSQEGRSGGTWVLVDLNDILVNVFYQDKREEYGLDDLWKNLPQIDYNKLVEKS